MLPQKRDRLHYEAPRLTAVQLAQIFIKRQQPRRRRLHYEAVVSRAIQPHLTTTQKFIKRQQHRPRRRRLSRAKKRPIKILIAGDGFDNLSDIEKDPALEYSQNDADFQNRKKEPIFGPRYTEKNLPDSLFSYYEEDWLPTVRHQGELPICWALSTAQHVAAILSFHRRDRVDQLSPQCIINGLPSFAANNAIDLILIKNEGGKYIYRQSTYMALSFIGVRGITTEASYRLSGVPSILGFLTHHKEFKPRAGIYAPFNVPRETSTEVIRRILIKHGPLLGTFYCSQRLGRYRGAPEIYEEARNRRTESLELHCVLVVGAGRINERPFLHIQNSYGDRWGNNGFGYVALHMFEQLQGLKLALEHPQEKKAGL